MLLSEHVGYYHHAAVGGERSPGTGHVAIFGYKHKIYDQRNKCSENSNISAEFCLPG